MRWKGGWKITLIDYPLKKKVYGTDQYVVENSGLTGQGKHKTGLCQGGSKKKSLEKNVKPVPCPSLVQETYPDSAKSTPLFLSPSLLLLSSSFLLSFLFSCVGLIFFRKVYGLDELLKCLPISQLLSPLWCQTLCFSGEGDKQSSFTYQEQPLCTPVSF